MGGSMFAHITTLGGCLVPALGTVLVGAAANIRYQHDHQETRHDAGRHGENPFPVGFPLEMHKKDDEAGSPGIDRVWRYCA